MHDVVGDLVGEEAVGVGDVGAEPLVDLGDHFRQRDLVDIARAAASAVDGDDFAVGVVE